MGFSRGGSDAVLSRLHRSFAAKTAAQDDKAVSKRRTQRHSAQRFRKIVIPSRGFFAAKNLCTLEPVAQVVRGKPPLRMTSHAT